MLDQFSTEELQNFLNFGFEEIKKDPSKNSQYASSIGYLLKYRTDIRKLAPKEVKKTLIEVFGSLGELQKELVASSTVKTIQRAIQKSNMAESESDQESYEYNYENNIASMYIDRLEVYTADPWGTTASYLESLDDGTRQTVVGCCILWYIHPPEWLLMSKTKTNKNINEARVTAKFAKFLPKHDPNGKAWKERSDRSKARRSKWGDFETVNESMVTRVALIGLQYGNFTTAEGWAKRYNGKPFQIDTKLMPNGVVKENGDKDHHGILKEHIENFQRDKTDISSHEFNYWFENGDDVAFKIDPPKKSAKSVPAPEPPKKSAKSAPAPEPPKAGSSSSETKLPTSEPKEKTSKKNRTAEQILENYQPETSLLKDSFEGLALETKVEDLETKVEDHEMEDQEMEDQQKVEAEGFDLDY